MNRRALLLAGLGLLAACGSEKSGPVYVLADGEKRAAENPSTFEIPPREKRHACKAGDLVKIILELPPGAPPREKTGERPWMHIQEVRPGPRYVALFDNDLVVFTELDPKAPIEFGPEHIIQIWEDKKP